MRALPALFLLTCLAGCASTATMQSARPMGHGEVEVALELSHGVALRPVMRPPLASTKDPLAEYVSVNGSGFDLSARVGLEDEIDGVLRLGSAGAEVGLKRALSHAPERAFAWAGLVTTRVRLDLAAEVTGALLLEAEVAPWQRFVVTPRLHLTAASLGEIGSAPISGVHSYNVAGIAPGISLTSLSRIGKRASLGVEISGRHRGYPARTDMTWPFWISGSFALMIRQ